jgi:hypothetical protein
MAENCMLDLANLENEEGRRKTGVQITHLDDCD